MKKPGEPQHRLSRHAIVSKGIAPNVLLPSEHVCIWWPSNGHFVLAIGKLQSHVGESDGVNAGNDPPAAISCRLRITLDVGALGLHRIDEGLVSKTPATLLPPQKMKQTQQTTSAAFRSSGDGLIIPKFP